MHPASFDALERASFRAEVKEESPFLPALSHGVQFLLKIRTSLPCTGVMKAGLVLSVWPCEAVWSLLCQAEVTRGHCLRNS